MRRWTRSVHDEDLVVPEGQLLAVEGNVEAAVARLDLQCNVITCYIHIYTRVRTCVLATQHNDDCILRRESTAAAAILAR